MWGSSFRTNTCGSRMYMYCVRTDKCGSCMYPYSIWTDTSLSSMYMYYVRTDTCGSCIYPDSVWTDTCGSCMYPYSVRTDTCGSWKNWVNNSLGTMWSRNDEKSQKFPETWQSSWLYNSTICNYLFKLYYWIAYLNTGKACYCRSEHSKLCSMCIFKGSIYCCW